MFENGLNLHRLLLYRNVSEDEAVQKAQTLAANTDIQGHKECFKIEKYYFDMLHCLIQKAEEHRWNGDLWRNYVLELILKDENLFSLAGERNPKSISDGLNKLAIQDIGILKNLYNFNLDYISKHFNEAFSYNFQIDAGKEAIPNNYGEQFNYIKELFNSDQSPQVLANELANFYHTRGCGIMSKYLAFSWDQGLKGIENPDPIKLEDLVGYEYQKQILTSNTAAFVRGKKANNILLYGEKGTGKSSSVKALLDKFAGQGLRMIELGKKQLLDLPRVLETVRKRGMYFIIFIDDLSFEDFEVEYKEIKACIDGSLQARPDNVLLYVTSNRRHLIRENWSDRKSSGEEIHISDTYQEKLSFADRFGIIISYQSPNQDEYLQIIDELARKNNVSMPAEELKKLALQWERKYHGRSGRTAQQFITAIISSV